MSKPAGGAGAAGAKKPGAGGKKSRLPSLEDFLQSGDYTGAVTFLEFQRRMEEGDNTTLPWLAWCAFHLGDTQKAMRSIEEAAALKASAIAAGTAGANEKVPAEIDPELCKAVCLFHEGKYADAEALASTAPDCPLKHRLLFHASNKLGNEAAVRSHLKSLTDSKLDQLSLAAMQYLRSHHAEAIDIYKRILLENRDDIALNVYISLCYYKLDYYDVSQEVLAIYLQSRPTSVLALNLKACNQFRLLNGKAAEAELRSLADLGLNVDGSELMRHNLVVFRNGDGAPRILPALLDKIPEARLNLVIYHLKAGNVGEAAALIDAITPTLPPEYVLKAICHAQLAQMNPQQLQQAAAQAAARAGGNNSSAVTSLSTWEHAKAAQQLFHLVGASASECDTIPGRQCMASCFFLQRSFDDVNVYLGSVKPYMYNDDDFNWNSGMSLAATGESNVRLRDMLCPCLLDFDC
jgi:intraflagellar transport protein 56